LGESAESDFEQFGYELRRGETLLIFASGISSTTPPGFLAAETAVANALEGKQDLSAAELVAAVQTSLATEDHDHDQRDRSILAVKRTTA
jgi:hypothetical protein